MSESRIKMLLADDHPLIRSGMRAQLELLGRFDIEEAWDYTSMQSALARARSVSQPIDLVLADVQMPGMSGIESLVFLAEQHADVAFLVVTGLDLNPLINICQAQSNIRGLLDKSGSANELRQRIDMALAGVTLWPPQKDNTAVTVQSLCGSAQLLSPRLESVARCVAQGMSNAEIAKALGLTEGTVKVYLKTIFKTVGVSNRTQLALKLR